MKNFLRIKFITRSIVSVALVVILFSVPVLAAPGDLMFNALAAMIVVGFIALNILSGINERKKEREENAKKAATPPPPEPKKSSFVPGEIKTPTKDYADEVLADRTAEETAKPAEEPAEEPATEATEPAEEAAEEPAAEPAAEPAEEIAEEPAAEVAEEVVEEPEAEPAEEVAEEPAAETAEEVAEEPAAEPIEETEDDKKSNSTFPVGTVRYRWSFLARLSQTNDETKLYYLTLRNTMLGYQKSRSSISWGHDSYFVGRTQYARLKMRGKKLYIYLPFTYEEMKYSKYIGEDASGGKENGAFSFAYPITGARRLKYAVELVRKAYGELPYNEPEAVDLAKAVAEYPYEEISALVEKKLIKSSGTTSFDFAGDAE